MSVILAIVLVGALIAAAVWWLWPVLRGDAHGLTLMCPIRAGSIQGESLASITRCRLQALATDHESPFARVPNTYLCRAYVLDDVPYQRGRRSPEEHLASAYLVLSVNYHGALDRYLDGLWARAGRELAGVWEHCVGYEKVTNAEEFKGYIRACSVHTTFFFNGSTDEPLEEQLKGLYLKNELSRFAFDHQGVEGEELRDAFERFVARTRPREATPGWVPGHMNGVPVMPVDERVH